MSDNGTILIVDDTLASLRLLADTLKQEGYAVRPAPSGEIALRSAQSYPPDLILLDARMPGMDGYETCRRLKADPRTRNVPIIFLSAATEPDDKILGFELGAVDFLSKPFQRGELLVRVAAHLKLYRLSSQLEMLVDERTQALAESEARFRIMIEKAPEAIFLFDIDRNHFIEVNRKAELLTGRSREDLLASNIESLYGDLPQPDGKAVSDSIGNHNQRALAGNEVQFERLLRHADGHGIDCEVRLVMFPSKQQRLVRASVVDISARKAAEAQIVYLAHHDLLTGLANLYSLQLHLQRGIAAAEQAGNKVAVLQLDLDAFRLINEGRGQQVGDKLLMEVAHRLQNLIAGHGIAARQSGDEFILVLDAVYSREDIVSFARQVEQLIGQPYVLEGCELQTTASIGISVFPDDGADGVELIRKGDMALHHAKSRSGRRYEFFHENMMQDLLQRVQLEAGLRRAIKENQFILHYQPQIDLAKGRVTGLEALMRWQDPERGLISPAAFIPVAEQTGLISTLGAWALREACRQLKAWQQAGLQDLTVSVNLSAEQFQDGELAQFVADTLRETGLDARWLDLEITESCTMASPELAIAVMQALVDVGVSISIDDFGTGYSSLAYLKQFPIHTLKIDRSFVLNIESDLKAASVCDTIAHLAHRLDFRVVAEGVETAEQLKFLVSVACDCIQGFYFSKPLPPEQVPAFVNNCSVTPEGPGVTYFAPDLE